MGGGEIGAGIVGVDEEDEGVAGDGGEVEGDAVGGGGGDLFVGGGEAEDGVAAHAGTVGVEVFEEVVGAAVGEVSPAVRAAVGFGAAEGLGGGGGDGVEGVGGAEAGAAVPEAVFGGGVADGKFVAFGERLEAPPLDGADGFGDGFDAVDGVPAVECGDSGDGEGEEGGGEGEALEPAHADGPAKDPDEEGEAEDGEADDVESCLERTENEENATNPPSEDEGGGGSDDGEDAPEGMATASGGGFAWGADGGIFVHGKPLVGGLAVCKETSSRRHRVRQRETRLRRE